MGDGFLKGMTCMRKRGLGGGMDTLLSLTPTGGRPLLLLDGGRGEEGVLGVGWGVGGRGGCRGEDGRRQTPTV